MELKIAYGDSRLSKVCLPQPRKFTISSRSQRAVATKRVTSWLCVSHVTHASQLRAVTDGMVSKEVRAKMLP